MSVYTVPALNAVDFALTAHTVPSLASPETALQAYTVPALNAVDFALTTTTPPTYMDVGWELLPAVGGTVNGAVSATLAGATQGSTGTVPIGAIVGQALGALTQSATGCLVVAAASSHTLGDASHVATGHLPVTGQAEQTLGALVQVATATMAGVQPEPAPAYSGSGGGGSVFTYRINPRRFEVRKAIERARRELQKARTPKARKRRLRKAAEMVSEVFDLAASGYGDVTPQVSLKPLVEAMSAVETLARRIDAQAELSAASAKEMQDLFDAYQRELERIERQEEEDAVAALMVLSTAIH